MVAVTEQKAMDRQYLTFSLEDEAFGVDILQVQEIRGWEEVRPIPDTPNYIKGVLNLRGAIVPIIDLRERFRLHNASYTPTTVIIVLSVKVANHQQVMGMVVDGVSDVLQIGAEEIQKPPNLGSKINTKFIHGMTTHEEVMVMLLNTDKLLDPEAFELIEQISE